MFIRKTRKKDTSSGKLYYSYQLIESIRTEKGPRQRILLNLGNNLDLSKEDLSALANCIEDIVLSRKTLFPMYTEEIQKLAEIYAQQLIRKQSELFTELECKAKEKQTSTDYVTIDCNTIEHECARSIGVEHIAYSMFKKLGLDKKLAETGLTKREIAIATGVIIGKLAQPSSERATYKWLQSQSAIGELLDQDFSKLSMKSIYRSGDLLFQSKKELEEHLYTTEKDLFSLEDTVLLYDLTNTYFEGSACAIQKAKRGKSKEKRADTPLVTLGLVVNNAGFIKRSTILSGNVSEPGTLKEALNRIDMEGGSKPTIVLDAGIATEENLKWLRDKGYFYIVSSRRAQEEDPVDVEFTIVREEGANVVKAAKVEDSETKEVIVHCHSTLRGQKEESMKTSFQRKFEESLHQIKNSLTKKRGTKSYSEVLERIGRLKQKYPQIASCYTVKVIQEDAKEELSQKELVVKDITWELNETKCDKKFSGKYQLRTFGLEWDCERLWKTYIMLTRVEEGFRCLKSELGLRPIYHQTESRVDGHLFITVLAYHIMQSILHSLRENGINYNWRTIRRIMSTQVRVTTSVGTKEGKRMRIRSTTTPEMAHKEIYKALGISMNPGRLVKTIY